MSSTGSVFAGLAMNNLNNRKACAAPTLLQGYSTQAYHFTTQQREPYPKDPTPYPWYTRNAEYSKHGKKRSAAPAYPELNTSPHKGHTSNWMALAESRSSTMMLRMVRASVENFIMSSKKLPVSRIISPRIWCPWPLH